MRYYYREHLEGYRRVAAEGKTAWGEIHGTPGFESFSSRAFLETVLPRLVFSSPRPAVLEMGCGTGPGACFFAERGFDVDAFDLIPTAIEIAREQARIRDLEIRFWVQDACALPHEGKPYDLVVDSYMLQGIVTDEDRNSVFAAVRARLKREGTYLVSSAVFDASRLREEEPVVDKASGTVYHRYGTQGLIDLQTSIAYVRLDEGPRDYEDAVCVNDAWFLPHRRHRKAPALRAEVEDAGFSVLYQDDVHGGDLVCVHKGTYSGRPF